jgi:hypothetical protein
MARRREPSAAPPAPRFATGLASLVYALAVLLLAYPAVAGGFLVSPISDQYIGGFPVRQFAAEVLRETGGFPLWNPYIFGGLPYVAAMHGDIFYPTFLLRMVMPVDAAMTWGFVIHLFLAGLFTYVFLRAVGLPFLPALIGGLAYMMGGPIASYASPGHDGKLYVSALYPLMLFLLLRGVRDGRNWVWGVMALVTGLAVLSPHPQLLQYMLLSSGAFALYLAFVDSGEHPLPRGVAFRRLGLALVALLFGAAIGAIQYTPVREYVAWSPRSESGMSRGWDHAVSYSFPPEELLNTIVPQFSGLLENYWGRNGIHLHSEYLGVAVLVLASLAFARQGSSSRRSFLWFWTGTAIVGLLWSLGGFTPFYRLVYALVPGAKFFRAPSTFFFIVAFSVAVLVAIGAERALRGAATRRFLIGWGVAATVIALLGVSGGFIGLGASLAAPERYEDVLANRGSVTFGALRSALFLLGAIGVLALLSRNALKPFAGGAALAFLLTVDLWSIERLYWRFSPPAAEIYASDPAIDYMKRQPQPGRVLALQPVPSRDPFLSGDALMVHDIRQVLGYHGNELARYQELTGKQEGYRYVLTPALWRLLNAKYLLTDLDTAAVPELRLLVGPVRNAYGTTVYLYELPGENPFAWVAAGMVKAEDAAVLPVLRDARFDPRRVALFDAAAPVDAPTQLSTLPAPVSVPVSVTSYAPGRITLRLDGALTAPAALVVSENYYPGWQARVDDRPARLGRANYVLIGVELPAGARTVELTFRSRPYEIGKMITLVALLVAALFAAGGVFLDRGRRV